MMQRNQTGEQVSDNEITLDFRQLKPWERNLLLSILYGHKSSHPLLHYALRQNHKQLQLLCRYLAATLRLSFPNMLRDINHHNSLLRREEIYQQLLLANTPKKALRLMFAKSTRDIERDRAEAGVNTGKRGRPAKILGPQAYDVVGRWNTLQETETDMATNLAKLHEEFRNLAVSSLYNLITNL